MHYKYLNNPKGGIEVLKKKWRYLVEVCRENNANLKRCTWRRKIPIKQAGLDFVLLSENSNAQSITC